MIPLESPVPEIGPPGSESGERKRTHGTRPAARLRKRRISHRPPTGYAPLLDSTAFTSSLLLAVLSSTTLVIATVISQVVRSVVHRIYMAPIERIAQLEKNWALTNRRLTRIARHTFKTFSLPDALTHEQIRAIVTEHERTHDLRGLCNGLMGGLELNADRIGYLVYEFDDDEDTAGGTWGCFESRKAAEESLGDGRYSWRVIAHIPAGRQVDSILDGPDATTARV